MSMAESRVAQRVTEGTAVCHYCRNKWPFFGDVDGQPLPFHHRPEDPDWHARVPCQAVQLLPGTLHSGLAHRLTLYRATDRRW